MQKLLRVSAVLLAILLTSGVLQLTPAAQAKGKGKKARIQVQVSQDKAAVLCSVDCGGGVGFETVTDDAGSCCQACLDGCGARFCSGGNEEISIACWYET